MTTNTTRKWIELAYCTTPVFHPQNPQALIGIGGRAVGSYRQGLRMSALVIFPSVWPEHFDWVAIAQKRLDTFLDEACTCSQFQVCPLHELWTPQWLTQDMARNVIVPEMVPKILHGIVTPKVEKTSILS